MIDHEIREYYKNLMLSDLETDEHPKPVNPKQEVVTAVGNIYQSELGHFFEDEASAEFYNEIAQLYDKHSEQVEDHSALVDRILEDMPCVPIEEQIAASSPADDREPTASRTSQPSR